MNTILRGVTMAGNRLYQVSRFQQPSVISPFVSSFHNVRLQSNDSVDGTSYTRKEFVIGGPFESEILSDKYTNMEVVEKALEILGGNPKVVKCETIKSERSRMISVDLELTSSDDVESLLSNCDKLFKNLGLYIRKQLTPEEQMDLQKMLERKKAEDPTKNWVLRHNKVVYLDYKGASTEEERARTIVMDGQLTKEIESGSDLPALEVINEVFRILNLGHSPEIEEWNEKYNIRSGRRQIFVKLVNVDDAFGLLNLRVNLKDHGKMVINIRRSAAEQTAFSKLVEEKKQKMIEDPSMYYYIYHGKVCSKPKATS